MMIDVEKLFYDWKEKTLEINRLSCFVQNDLDIAIDNIKAI